MNNAEIIQKELEWLERIIKVRLEFPKVDVFDPVALNIAINRSNTLLMNKDEYDIVPPDFNDYSSSYSNAIRFIDWKERLMLILTLSNHIESGFIDRIIERTQYASIIEKIPGFWPSSGIVGRGSYGYNPTGRFWLYLLAGYDNLKKIELLNEVLGNKVQLLYTGMIEMTYLEDHEPFLGGILMIKSGNLTKLLF